MQTSAAIPTPSRSQQPSWPRWVLPSFTDLFFLMLTGILAFTPASKALLADADTGWHIRDGEFILATHSVPHTDLFSYTRAGQPWYAWEWLYDAGIAGIHHFAGLNGVLFFTALVIALTYALLFRLLLRRSGNFAVSAGLTLMAASTAQFHMLARPHVLSWLFTVIWVDLLYRFEEGERAALFWLPPFMLIWVNLHGGFLLGLALLALFGCAAIWRFAAGGRGAGRQILQLAIAFAACLGMTFLTPYGYKLHIHIYQYLSNGFLMNAIDEFMSPDFHASGLGYFEVLILLTVLAIALAHDRLTATDLLIVLFSLHAALYAKRNIPLAAILIGFSTARLWAGIVSRDGAPNLPAVGRVGVDGARRSGPAWLGSLLEAVDDISGNMVAMETQFRGHGLAILALAAATAIVLNGGRLFSAQVVSAQFNEKKFPVRATEFIRGKNIHDHLFNPDDWSGYLIYRLYPETKVFFDDRHDFYGEAFVREYVQASDATSKWRQPLDKYQVKWVLVPAASPLATVLKESKDWRTEFDDGMAAIFSRPDR